MYLLALEITLNISASALLSWVSSINLAIFSLKDVAILISSSSTGALSLSVGSVPPKYFSTIATVLETRFPRSFARSELILLIIISLENELSAPSAISLKIWYLIASAPYLSPNTIGSTTLPIDLLIF